VASARAEAIMEQIAVAIMAAGLVIGTVGHIWLIVRGWQVRWYWAVLLLFSPLAILFLIRHFHKAIAPVAVMVLGIVLIAAPVVYSHFVPPDLGEFVQHEPDGTLTVGLTGWNRKDYSTLAAYPRIAKLTMANADVTDETLEYIKHCPELRELDLSRTQVTDAGLATLAGLPKLEVLTMRGTHVTDAGFKQHLEALPTLMVIDFRETGVSLETQREWKKAVKGRKFLKE
jgi:hypothetical protein